MLWLPMLKNGMHLFLPWQGQKIVSHLFLPGQKVHSIFHQWKSLTLKPPNQFYVTRKNSSILYKFPTS